MDKIMFSIIVPFYNTEKYIKECLLSLTKQSVKNIEIICLDDGSTDGSLDIVKEMQENDSRIRIIRQENKGLSVARNRGVLEASGKYICFVDSDDMLIDGALEKIRIVLLEKEYQFICFNMSLLYEPGTPRPKNDYFIRKYEYDETTVGKQLFIQMMKNDDFCVCACLLCVNRKWLIDKNIFFNPGVLYEDNIYTIECYLKADNVRYIAEELYVYRKRNGSIMSGMKTCRDLQSLVFIFGHIWRFIAQYEKDELLYTQLLRYMNTITEQIRNINKRVTYLTRSMYKPQSMSDDTLFRYANIGRYESQEYDEEFYWNSFLNKLESVEEIILYGAGEKGKFVYEYLNRKGLSDRVAAFTVTSVPKGKKIYLGRPVYSMESIARHINSIDALVILTVNRERQYELRKECNSFNVKQVIGLDRVLEQRMRDEMLEL